jgi:hypothetical protein
MCRDNGASSLDAQLKLKKLLANEFSLSDTEAELDKV